MRVFAMTNRRNKNIAKFLGIASTGSALFPPATFAATTSECHVQTPSEEQIAAVTVANPAVTAAEAALISAQSVLATKKALEAKAFSNYQKALKTPSKSDDAALLRVYQSAKQARINAQTVVINAQTRATETRQSVKDKINNQYATLCRVVGTLTVSALPSSDQVKLAWNAVAGATAYVVSRDGHSITTTEGHNFIDTDVHNSTTYRYTITAIASLGADQNLALTQSDVVATPVLSKPTGIQAKQVGTHVHLSWLPSSHATSYNIFRDGEFVASTAAVQFDDYTSGGSYQVQAVQEGVVSAKSVAVKISIVIQLDQPEGLSAKSGNKSVSLTWEQVEYAAGYRIMRNGVTIATTNEANYVDTAVANGTTYFYRVVATNGKFESLASVSVLATPVAPLVIPQTPTGLVATSGNSQVALSWQAVSGATTYKLFRDSVLLTSITGTSFTDATVINGMTYNYAVQASNAAGDSAKSSNASATPALPVAPAIPSGLSAYSSDKKVTLTWVAVSGATSYQVLRDGVLIASPAITTFNDTAVLNGTTYSYTVRATNLGGSSGLSDSVTAKPMQPVPSAPTNVSASASNAQVTVTWATSVSATSYKVYRDGNLLTTTVATSFVDATVSNGTTYSYSVRAINGTGESNLSSPALASPIAPPEAPTNLVPISGNSQVTLSWASSATATSYKIYRNDILLVTTQATTYVDKSAINGTTYSYAIKASNLGGDSVSTTSVIAKPEISAPNAPANLVATAGNSKVSLSWTSAATAVSYKIYRDGTFLASSATTAYLDGTAVNGTAYSYAVSAVNAGGESAQSSFATATPSLPPAPLTPTNLLVTPGNNQVSLSWSSSATATGYKIYRDGTLLASPTSPTYIDSAVINGTNYSYTVSAINDGGESAKTAARSAVPQVPAPSSPTNLQASAGDGSVSLTWTASATATAYKIYRGGTLLATQSGTTYTDTGLTNGTLYSYTIKASNAGGESGTSSVASATPVASVVKLATPTGLTANTATSLNSGAFRLSWSAVSGATSYTVYKNGSVLGTTSSTTYTPASTTPGSTSAYTVMATNGTVAQNSNQSAAITAGVYQGSSVNDQLGRTVYGQIQVYIIVNGTTGKSVTGCWATYPTSSDSGPINNSAIPKLCSSVLTLQPTSTNATTSIASVSGASATSPAFKTSLANALSQAGL